MEIYISNYKNTQFLVLVHVTKTGDISGTKKGRSKKCGKKLQKTNSELILKTNFSK